MSGKIPSFFLSSVIVQERKHIPFHLDRVHPPHSRHSHLLGAYLCLSYIHDQERKYPLLGSPEMSGKLRYECRLYLHPFTTPIAFCSPYFLSSVVVQERKLYTRHYTPFRGSPEMSGKLRYESQIILRYYVLIIHEVSLERPTTSTYKTIHLERQTAPHFLSHWTTHLQY
jgi:hypothetical protein